MKTLNAIKRIALTAVVVLSIGLAIAPRADASVQPATSGHSVTDPLFGGGGKDGNESHG
jgi:hypothetical protein